MSLEDLRLPFDVCANNHGGNEVSIDANKKLDKKAVIAKIIAFMQTRPRSESYVKEIIDGIGIPHQTTSARLSDMKAAGLIEPVKVNGKQLRVDGCGVVRLIPKQSTLF